MKSFQYLAIFRSSDNVKYAMGFYNESLPMAREHAAHVQKDLLPGGTVVSVKRLDGQTDSQMGVLTPAN